MPGLGRKVFSAGEVLTAANVQGYLQDQAVMVFAGTAAAGSALGTAVSEGMVRYVQDTNELHFYDGSTWTDVGVVDVAGKNRVINGAFDVWQRGTSFAVGTSRVYTADRWNAWRGSLVAGMTVSRQSSGLTGFQYSARVQRDSGNAGTQQLRFAQDFETVSSLPIAGQPITVSFYAKAGANYSQTSNGLQVEVVSGTGTDQTIINGYTGSTSVVSQTATLTTSWQRFSYTGSLASTATQVGIVFNFTPTGTAGANDWFEITGVQLEVGQVASPFSRAAGTLQGEFAACRRYFQQYDVVAVNRVPGTGMANSTTSGRALIKFDVPMRTAPTYSTVGTIGNLRVYDGSVQNAPTATSFEVTDANSALINFTGTTGLTLGRSVEIYNNTGTFSLQFSSEL